MADRLTDEQIADGLKYAKEMQDAGMAIRPEHIALALHEKLRLLRSAVNDFDGGCVPACDSYSHADDCRQDMATTLTLLRERLEQEQRALVIAAKAINNQRAKFYRLTAERDALDKALNEEIETRDSYEDCIAEIAHLLGCEKEWSSAHDHVICAKEAAADIESRARREAFEEAAKLVEETVGDPRHIAYDMGGATRALAEKPELLYYHMPHEFDAPGPRDSFTSCRTCGKGREHEQHAEKPSGEETR